MSESAMGKLKDKLKAGKIVEIILVLVLAAVVIAVLYSVLGGDKVAEAEDSYARQLEQKLGDVLSRIDGAGDTQVFVHTASEDGETIIAMETIVEADGTTSTTPVLVGGDVVVLEKRMPEITGVLIVSEGADSVLVRIRLIDAAASALDIDQSKIKIYTKGTI